MNESNQSKESLPKVSVVMPCFNEEDRVVRALDSILNQSFTDFEFIVIDDKSTDRTPEIIAEYASRDSRVVFVQNEKNVGYAVNLNRGIERAKSDIIARMDADDYSYPTRFEKQYEFLKANPDVDIVGTAARLISKSNGDVMGDCFLYETHEEIVKNKYSKSFNFHPSIMARKKLFVDNGGYDDTVLRAEEYHLWLKAHKKFRFHNLPEVLIDYYVKDSADVLRFDHFSSGVKVRYDAMVDNKELLANAPQLGRYIASYFVRWLIKKTYWR